MINTAKTILESQEMPSIAIFENEKMLELMYKIELEKRGFSNICFYESITESDEVLKNGEDLALVSDNFGYSNGSNCINAEMLIFEIIEARRFPYFIISPLMDKQDALNRASRLLKENCLGVLTRHWYRNESEIGEIVEKYQNKLAN